MPCCLTVQLVPNADASHFHVGTNEYSVSSALCGYTLTPVRTVLQMHRRLPPGARYAASIVCNATESPLQDVCGTR
jgi:hypothetical protein